jgi:serine/threonine protein kinase
VRKKYFNTGQILGQGAFGVVVLYKNRTTDKPVAIKIVRKERVKSLEMEIMKDEIAIMSRMDHDNVIKHIESFEDARYMYMVMEALTGALELEKIYHAERISKQIVEAGDVPVFDEQTVKWIIRALFRGLSHIHANGIVHRDLKPANILIDTDKHLVKIIDFGLSKRTVSDQVSHTLIGTLEYIAPEVFDSDEEDDPYDAPCDVWAAGLICFQLLAGKNPMKKFTPQATKEAI